MKLALRELIRRPGRFVTATVILTLIAILLMFLNSMFETGFERLSENRRHVRETIARAKRELTLHTTVQPAPTVETARHSRAPSDQEGRT